MTCVKAGRIYVTRMKNKKVIGVIDEGEWPTIREGREIVYVQDENKLILQKIFYDKVNEKLHIMQIATYDSDDECAKASFETLFNEPSYNDFMALWTYLLARVQETKS
jgi:hypothetical protein